MFSLLSSKTDNSASDCDIPRIEGNNESAWEFWKDILNWTVWKTRSIISVECTAYA